MKILAIETSCDETAIALVEASGDLDNPKFTVLSKKIHSQIEEHKEYGGVYPSLAKREHAKNIIPVLKEVLSSYFVTKASSHVIPAPTHVIPAKAGIQAFKNNESELKEILKREPELFESMKDFLLDPRVKPEDDVASGGLDIDMIAVTSGPGLEPALWVGINFAKALSLAWQIPLLPVNHMEGHMASVLINNTEESQVTSHKSQVNFPALSLLISGGHTELVEIKNWNEYKILGKTKDDAVGESYDKVARLLGIPYPGGPEISRLASKFRLKSESSSPESNINFPRPMINSDDLDFSFSGLKTAVLYFVQNRCQKSLVISQKLKEEIAGEFEQAVVDVLNKKVQKALQKNNFKSLIVAGGVVANNFIRENLAKIAEEEKIEIYFPDPADSTDNAQMIAVAGYLKSFAEKPRINPEIKACGGLTYNN